MEKASKYIASLLSSYLTSSGMGVGDFWGHAACSRLLGLGHLLALLGPLQCDQAPTTTHYRSHTYLESLPCHSHSHYLPQSLALLISFITRVTLTREALKSELKSEFLRLALWGSLGCLHIPVRVRQSNPVPVPVAVFCSSSRAFSRIKLSLHHFIDVYIGDVNIDV